MTIITHDGIIHIAYEGPYPWSDGALEKAKSGLDGWALTHGERAGYLEGDILSDWDTATGTFLGTRPVYKPSEEEKLNAEMQELQSRIDDLDRKAIRAMRAIRAGTATAEDAAYLAENEAQVQAARARISEIRVLLKTEGI